MVNAWIDGWTARPGWQRKWRPGNASETLGKHASTGASLWPLPAGSSANFTRQMKIDGLLARPAGAAAARPSRPRAAIRLTGRVRLYGRAVAERLTPRSSPATTSELLRAGHPP